MGWQKRRDVVSRRTDGQPDRLSTWPQPTNNLWASFESAFRLFSLD